jgi:hypothetical protein
LTRLRHLSRNDLRIGVRLTGSDRLSRICGLAGICGLACISRLPWLRLSGIRGLPWIRRLLILC